MQQLGFYNDPKRNSLHMDRRNANGKRVACLKGKLRPFVKWAGGKTQLLYDLSRLIPKEYKTYYEPFVGSGALFFHLLPDKAVINDANEELINVYLVIRDEVEDLIKDLRKHINSRKYYYQIRNLDQNKLSNLERASRFIYLNRTCYNGLYRVNKKNKFNVPYGRYKNPKICNKKNLRLISGVLRSAKVHIKAGDYREVISKVSKNDFVYLDPPYYPISKYSDFKRYTKDFFYEKDHITLAKEFKSLAKRGCYLMLSNSFCKFTIDLYKDFNCHTVLAKRSISKNGNERNKIKELIVTNY